MGALLPRARVEPPPGDPDRSHERARRASNRAGDYTTARERPRRVLTHLERGPTFPRGEWRPEGARGRPVSVLQHGVPPERGGPRRALDAPLLALRGGLPGAAQPPDLSAGRAPAAPGAPPSPAGPGGRERGGGDRPRRDRGARPFRRRARAAHAAPGAGPPRRPGADPRVPAGAPARLVARGP